MKGKSVKSLARARYEYADNCRTPWRRGNMPVASRFYKKTASRARRAIDKMVITEFIDEYHSTIKIICAIIDF